jgi:hypothetical protein
MMKHTKTTFVFMSEFGARRRALRRASEAADIAAKTFNIWKAKLQPVPQSP